jgi:uncharacterized protein (UPF0335 family)
MQNADNQNSVEHDGVTTKVTVRGETFELNDEQLEEVGQRLRPGHNRTGGIAADQLRSIIERVERLEDEKAGIASDIKDIYAEAKGNGYDVKTLRKVISLRKIDASERNEQEHLLDTYLGALGMRPEMEED